MSESVIEVSLVLPSGTGPLRSARVWLRLLDVTEIDASSRVVAERIFESLDYDPSSAPRPLALAVDESLIDPEADYIVDVRVEAGTGRDGVLITTRSIPALTRGRGSRVEVPLTRLEAGGGSPP